MIKEAMALSHLPDMLFSGESSTAVLHNGSVLCYPYSIMKIAEKQLHKPMAHWSMYDLRKTARTNWSTIAEPHVCELMLGHVLPGVWQVYDRHAYLEEQADAYRKWYARVMSIVNADTAEEG